MHCCVCSAVSCARARLCRCKPGTVMRGQGFLAERIAPVWTSLSRQRNGEKFVVTKNYLSQHNFSITRARTLSHACALFRAPKVAWSPVLGYAGVPRTLSPCAQYSCNTHCPVETKEALPIPNPIVIKDPMLQHEINNLCHNRDFSVATENRKWVVAHSSSFSELPSFFHAFHPLHCLFTIYTNSIKSGKILTQHRTSLNPSFYYKTYNLHISKLDILSRILQNN